MVALTATRTRLAAPSWSEGEFFQLVNDVLKQMASVLALARSPLADSPLVAPLLVLDDVSPTADERGQALRLVLEWAVTQLAPEAPRYPLGVERPLEDPTWRDSRWWRYTILRHRYLEPLHPDEFVERGRFTETLLALTGIPSADTFFDERNRAIREVAEWLWQQMSTGQADDELCELALEAAYRPLAAQPEARALLALAATFADVFPRTLLLQLAASEQLTGVDRALGYLTQHRFLQVGDQAQNLWMSPVLRRYIYQRQTRSDLMARHRRVALYFQTEGAALRAARHFQAAGQSEVAARLVLEAAPELVNELHAGDLLAVMDEFKRGQLSAPLWYAIQLQRVDLYRQRGLRAEALTACRAALRAAIAPADQARIYRRMGKLYEKHNQLHALGYYQQAVERFPPHDLELAELLKDRAWLYLLRQEWELADADLMRGLELTPETAQALRADLYDVLAGLARHQKRYPDAIAFGRDALGLREQTGDLLRVANSFNNLGLIYNDMGDYHHAIVAFREAGATYMTLGNQELVAGTLLNTGMAHHLDGHLDPAVVAYQECLALCQRIGLPLVEARAHSNLVEALADQGQIDAAQRHWQMGMDLSQAAGFDDEVAYYHQLLRNYPHLQPAQPHAPAAPRITGTDTVQRTAPGPQEPDDAEAILDLAQREGRITARRVVEVLGISKATATRRLADFATQGRLQRLGEGRGTYYTAVHAPNIRTLDGGSMHAPIGELDVDEWTAGALGRAAVAGKPANDADLGAPPPDLAPARLYQVAAQMPSRFGLTALGIAGTRRGALGLVARFDKLPDLPTFFRLEAALAAQLGQPVDLLPESVWQTQAPDEGVTWVWQG